MRFHTISILTFLSVGFILLTSEKCNENSALSGIPESISVTDTKSYKFNYENDKYEVSLINVKDSRCPKGCECIWEGVADITLAITKNSETENIVLHSTEKKLGDRPLSMSREAMGIYFKYKNASPYPICNEKIPLLKEYTITIDISTEPFKTTEEAEEWK